MSALCALALVGCPTPVSPPSDGGSPPPRDGAIGGRVVVELGVDADALEDDVVLELARIGVAELRAHNDRGGDLEPARADVGTLDVTTERARVDLSGAPPATYSSVGMTLAAPALALRITQLDTTYDVVVDRTVMVDARCDVPVALEPGGSLEIHVALDLGEIHAALRESTLPAPVGGVVRVDDTTAPDAIAEIAARMRERWQVECEPESPEL